jgi:hypothetical protein
MIQNLYFSVGDLHFRKMQEAAANGDTSAQKWITFFAELGDELEVKVS